MNYKTFSMYVLSKEIFQQRAFAHVAAGQFFLYRKERAGVNECTSRSMMKAFP